MQKKKGKRNDNDNCKYTRISMRFLSNLGRQNVYMDYMLVVYML